MQNPKSIKELLEDKRVLGWEKGLKLYFIYYVSGSQKRVSGGERISQLISCMKCESPTQPQKRKTADKYFLKFALMRQMRERRRNYEKRKCY